MSSKPSVMVLKRELYRTVLAEHCLERVIEMSDFCISKNEEGHTTCGYALLTAICVTYAKAFRNNEGGGQISEKFRRFTDSQQQYVHDLIMHARDGMFAHQGKDHCTLQIDIAREEQGNHYRFSFTPQLVQDYLKPRQLPTVKIMCQAVLTQLAVEHQRLMAELFDGKMGPPGILTLNLDDDHLGHSS
jgi:hypothetical protein